MLALAVGVETYFQNRDWPRIAAVGVVGATLLSLGLMVTTTLPAPGYSLDPVTSIPTGVILPGTIRLLTPFLNITGGLALILGALYSAYVFMPKRRVLPYSLDPGQKGDEFLFNLLIAPVAIVVNFVASLPGTLNALVHGRLHSPRPGHDPHRGRRPRGQQHRLAEPVRLDRAVPGRQARRRAAAPGAASSSRSRRSARSGSRSRPIRLAAARTERAA